MRKVVFLKSKGRLEPGTLPMPILADDDVLIQVKSIGICGSDVSYFSKGATGMGEITYPHILGHECAGIVTAVGKKVSRIREGDRVAVEPGMPCGRCSLCMQGRYNLCKELAFMSTAKVRPYSEGAFAEYIAKPQYMLHKLPDEVDFEQGALLEPLSVALHAIERSSIKMGQSAAILGAGPIGLALLLALKAMGISPVYASDILDSRLNFAELMGAYPLCVGKTEERNSLLSADTVDAVFDTTCNEEALNTALSWIRRGGKLVLVGVPASKIQMDMQTAFIKELDILPSFRYANTYQAAINLVTAGNINMKSIISHRFSLDQAQQAMELAAKKEAGTMKIMLEI